MQQASAVNIELRNQEMKVPLKRVIHVALRHGSSLNSACCDVES